jgi:hypothetical protein
MQSLSELLEGFILAFVAFASDPIFCYPAFAIFMVLYLVILFQGFARMYRLVRQRFAAKYPTVHARGAYSDDPFEDKYVDLEKQDVGEFGETEVLKCQLGRPCLCGYLYFSAHGFLFQASRELFTPYLFKGRQLSILRLTPQCAFVDEKC